MSPRLLRKRPLLTLPQLLLLLALLAALVIALDLNRRAQADRLAGVGEEELTHQLSFESTRQATLTATRTYVQSDDYVEDYARNEGGFVLPGEKRVSPVFVRASPESTSATVPTEDPAHYARPWQAWMRLLTDLPFPQQ